MGYAKKMEKVIEFIEENLHEEISIEVLAEICDLSKFYFHRMFTAMIGDSVMDYIRKRRLTKALEELTDSSRGILELAVDYGFGSQEAFTRAFKKLYGINPGEYRKKKTELYLHEKFNMRNKIYKGEMEMEPKFVVKQEFKVIGMEVKTTMKENEEKRSIPKLWDRYIPRMGEIKNVVGENKNLGLCEIVENSEDAFSYIACREVENFDFVPEGMVTKVVPASKYAVFTHKGPFEKMGDTYEFIYGKWLGNTSYQVNKEACDFELYDERSGNTEESEMDIYIPIK